MKNVDSDTIARQHKTYWRRTLRVTAWLLLAGFLVTFGVGWFARSLSGITVFGFPLPFLVAAQGALVVYVLIVWYYARYMNRMDRDYGIDRSPP